MSREQYVPIQTERAGFPRLQPTRDLLRVVLVFAAMSSSAIADTNTITFDDLTATAAGSAHNPVPDGYGGLNWTNFQVVDGEDSRLSGYFNGTVSPNNVVFNAGGAPSSLDAAALFNLDSAWLTGAWNDNLQVEARGYAGGNQIYDQTYAINATGPTLINFNFLGVDEVTFVSSGGFPHGYGGSGSEFVMDDVTLAEAPEPGTVSLMLLGVLLGGWHFLRGRDVRAGGGPEAGR